MLSRINRLTKKKDFQRVFKNGRRKESDSVWLKYLANNLNTVRFGFVVGIKVSKKAVERNKVKRRMRSVAFHWLARLGSYDLIVFAKPEAKDLAYCELSAELEKLLSALSK